MLDELLSCGEVMLENKPRKKVPSSLHYAVSFLAF
jgi:hypothetical protein